MSTSPYGPIAPPLRNTTNMNPLSQNTSTNNSPTTTSTPNSAGVGVGPVPAREVSNPYANANAYGTTIRSALDGGNC
jgi:hypothetical protein